MVYEPEAGILAVLSVAAVFESHSGVLPVVLQDYQFPRKRELKTYYLS